MHYKIGDYSLRSERDIVFIGNGKEWGMYAKPCGFDERLQDIFTRPADMRGDVRQIFLELFGVTKPEPKALDVDNNVYDG